MVKANKVNAIGFAKFLNIEVHHHKFVRKEIDIISKLNHFCDTANIRHRHLYSLAKLKKNRRYIVDYYLPDHGIVIEIDEFNHRDGMSIMNENVKNLKKNIRNAHLSDVIQTIPILQLPNYSLRYTL